MSSIVMAAPLTVFRAARFLSGVDFWNDCSAVRFFGKLMDPHHWRSGPVWCVGNACRAGFGPSPKSSDLRLYARQSINCRLIRPRMCGISLLLDAVEPNPVFIFRNRIGAGPVASGQRERSGLGIDSRFHVGGLGGRA